MRSCRVLVAEDDPGLREILLEGLTDEGFEVAAVEHGARALELARGGGFDVLLLDEEMPVMTGRQALRRLREAHVTTPAVIISGNLHMDDEERLRLDVRAVLRKPAPIGVIAHALRKASGIDENHGAPIAGGRP